MQYLLNSAPKKWKKKGGMSTFQIYLGGIVSSKVNLM